MGFRTLDLDYFIQLYWCVCVNCLSAVLFDLLVMFVLFYLIDCASLLLKLVVCIAGFIACFVGLWFGFVCLVRCGLLVFVCVYACYSCLLLATLLFGTYLWVWFWFGFGYWLVEVFIICLSFELCFSVLVLLFNCCLVLY